MNTLTPLLNVEDASRSIKFYADNFGFVVTDQFAIGGKLMWASLSQGAIRIMINVSHERTVRGRRSDPQSYDDVVFHFAVDSAQELHNELLRKGANPGPVERQDYGLDEFTVRDPDGYELAFGSPFHQ